MGLDYDIDDTEAELLLKADTPMQQFECSSDITNFNLDMLPGANTNTFTDVTAPSTCTATQGGESTTETANETTSSKGGPYKSARKRLHTNDGLREGQSKRMHPSSSDFPVQINAEVRHSSKNISGILGDGTRTVTHICFQKGEFHKNDAFYQAIISDSVRRIRLKDPYNFISTIAPDYKLALNSIFYGMEDDKWTKVALPITHKWAAKAPYPIFREPAMTGKRAYAVFTIIFDFIPGTAKSILQSEKFTLQKELKDLTTSVEKIRTEIQQALSPHPDANSTTRSENEARLARTRLEELEKEKSKLLLQFNPEIPFTRPIPSPSAFDRLQTGTRRHGRRDNRPYHRRGSMTNDESRSSSDSPGPVDFTSYAHDSHRRFY